MKRKRELKEDDLVNILLCDPITIKGKVSRSALGLKNEDLTTEFFWKKIRVDSKYSRNSFELPYRESSSLDKGILFYRYTVDNLKYREISERFNRFNEKYTSEIQGDSPLVVLGVAGNGKTIEINYRVHEVVGGDSDFTIGKAYINLEDIREELRYRSVFKCYDSKNPLWVFCTKILDSIMKYLRNNKGICEQIGQSFFEKLVKNNIATVEEEELFSLIQKYEKGDNETERKLFEKIKEYIDESDVEASIKEMLRILHWIMYCSDTTRQHYIIYDNIEQYIKLDGNNIQVPDSAISIIYRLISETIRFINSVSDRIEPDLVWKNFKEIIVLRRTSERLLREPNLHSNAGRSENISDITGHFELSAIWKKRKKNIWDDKLRGKIFKDNNRNKMIIKILDDIMNDVAPAKGNTYQSHIAPLMSYGIRRNARSQAHAAYEIYRLLISNDSACINGEQFWGLLSMHNNSRFLYRMALIEIQFKWSMAIGNVDRWDELGMGHPGKEKDIVIGDKITRVQEVEFYDNHNISMARRILLYLSSRTELGNINGLNVQKQAVKMFGTVSLYDLLVNVVHSPFSDSHKISDSDRSAFSRVLIALGDMLNRETKSAPYIILGIKDSDFHDETKNSVEILERILDRIWERGENGSRENEEYNSNDYGARVTDAGNCFLLDWLGSFAFMSALCCFTVPPLFFLKDRELIKYVIKTVYENTNQICSKYEEEAARYCGPRNTLRELRTMQVFDGQYFSFRERAKQLHTKYLRLYSDYIKNLYEKIGLTEDEMISLTAKDVDKNTKKPKGFIPRYISMYDEWNTEGVECF